MSFISKLLEPVRENPLVYLKAFLVRVFITCIELGLILVMQKIAGFVQHGNTTEIYAYLIYFPIGFVLIYILKWCMRDWFWPHPQTASYKYLRNKYLNIIINSENNYMEKIGSGKMIDTVKTGIDTHADLLDLLASRTPELILKPLFACRILSNIGIRYMVGFLVGFFVVSIISIKINARALQTRAERKEIQQSFMRRFIRFLSSRLEILYGNMIKKEISDQMDELTKLGKINYNVNNHLWMLYNIPIFFVQCLTICMIAYAYISLKENTFSLATYTGLATVIGFMATLCIELATKYKNATKDIANLEKLREYLDDAPVMQNYDTGEPFIYKDGTIELKNISFTYNEGSKVFDNFSLKIQGGKKTAFVGNSGSGKSTLVKLISGLLSPDSGQVLIDGQLIGSSPMRGAGEAGGVVSLKSFYQHIGFLQQEPIIFDGTVRENILYGLTTEQTNNHIQDTNQNQKSKLSPPDKGDTAKPRGFDLDSILQQSQCHFVYELPNGLNTEVGERGVRLSGGQKQRLAIARIFAKNPDIIILDEPTSALDSFAEEEITKAMHELCKGKTVLIIAHRLQTVKEADEIIVLGVPHPLLGGQGLGGDKKSDTTILERGTHTELTNNNGPYAKMLKLQTGF